MLDEFVSEIFISTTCPSSTPVVVPDIVTAFTSVLFIVSFPVILSLIIIVGAVLSIFTYKSFVVFVTWSPALPILSLKFIVNETLPSVDVSTTVYVAFQSFEEPLTLTLWPAIVTDGVVIFLSEVNFNVIISPSFARVVFELFEVISTSKSSGGSAALIVLL